MAQRIVILSRDDGSSDWTREGHNVTEGGRLVWSEYWPTVEAAREAMDGLRLRKGGEARVVVRDDSSVGGEHIVHKRYAQDH